MNSKDPHPPNKKEEKTKLISRKAKNERVIVILIANLHPSLKHGSGPKNRGQG